VFLTMMVIGLVGLVMMAVPALGGHRHLPPMHGHGSGYGHAHHAAHVAAPARGGAPLSGAGSIHGHATTTSTSTSATSAPNQMVLASAAHGGRRFIPSPRAVFSLLALYGASGNALVHAAHLPFGRAALLAIGPALLVEQLLIRPVWNLLFRFQADASAPLEQLILTEAHAVVPFRNGRGLVSTVRDGRRVQLSARLCEQQAARPIAVGQRLRIEDVDARQERVTVSVLSDSNDSATNTST
jgi:hypothetical protein